MLEPTRLEMLTEGSTPEDAETVSRHFAYFQDLTAKGVMILMGRTQNNGELSAIGIQAKVAISTEIQCPKVSF